MCAQACDGWRRSIRKNLVSQLISSSCNNAAGVWTVWESLQSGEKTFNSPPSVGVAQLATRKRENSHNALDQGYHESKI